LGFYYKKITVSVTCKTQNESALVLDLNMLMLCQ